MQKLGAELIADEKHYQSLSSVGKMMYSARISTGIATFIGSIVCISVVLQRCGFRLEV